MPRHYAITERTCLNGWWDFRPEHRNVQKPEIQDIPSDEWIPKGFLVPSFWTKPTDAVRERGEKHYVERKDTFDDPAKLTPDTEFLFDAFGYPNEWSQAKRAWMRRSFTLPDSPANGRWFLEFEALEPKGTLFVNGHQVATHIHPTLPLVADVTALLHPGDNELVVFINDYDRDENGRIKTPAGSWNVEIHRGIWQDVHLVRRGDVRVEDVVIQTSVREGRLDIAWTLANATGEEQTVEVIPTVHHWNPQTRTPLTPAALTPAAFTLAVPAHGEATHSIQIPWPDAPLWEPESPRLLVLDTRIADHEIHHERFGFREVWIDGPNLMLNGHPIHLFSDWGHKLTPYCFTESWVRQWFGMIRDGNMNHSRLHTHPHPELIMDLADEEGILITGETGIHGSGGALAADSPEFWDAARDHVRRFVKRDKNHPCILLWSVENEARWNPHSSRLLEDTLPKLRKLFNELDPTRAAYHEGDSSLWNEAEQEIISRHYYKACSGIGWWKGQRPLHSGEMAVYHLAGPNNTVQLAGDQAWNSFRALDEAAARDAAWIIEDGRTLGVCCFGPWNQSCLENLRLDSKFVEIEHPDVTSPGMKPLQVQPHSSEFAFWKPDGKGYTPNWSFPIQAQAFRPLAILDINRRTGYFNDAHFQRQLVIANDTAEAVTGTLHAALVDAVSGTILKKESADLTVARGERAQFDVAFDLADVPPARHAWHVEFVAATTGQTLDAWERQIHVASPTFDPIPGNARIAVVGSGSSRPIFERLRIESEHFNDLDSAIASGDFNVLVLEKHAVQPGSTQNRTIQQFCRNGGRVLVLEQQTSLFPQLPVEEKPLQAQFIRAYNHSVLDGITEADLAFWGESPYSLQGGESFVTHRPYRKGDGKHALPILDGDEGGFGDGGLDFTGLMEVREGQGLILACQLELTDKADTIPAAARLLVNCLRRLVEFQPENPQPPVVVDGKSLTSEEIANFANQAREGRSVIVSNASGNVLSGFGRELGMDLAPAAPEDPVYQAVRVADDPILDGVSNEDTCGIETWSYTSPDKRNCPVCEHPIQPTPQLEPLLETPTENVLYQFFVLGGRSEPLRAHTASRFLYDEKASPSVVLGRVRVGTGQILFNQFTLAEGAPERDRLQRLPNQIAANLGEPFDGSPLDGESIPDNKPISPGHPERVHVLNAPVNDELHRHLVSGTEYMVDQFMGMPIFDTGVWQRDVAAPDGEVQAETFDLQHPVYIYMQLRSAVARKDPESNLGVPNPEAYTFLDLAGRGNVETIVNAESFGKIELDGTATVSDIALEQGRNHVLLRWVPDSKNATLRMRWRNIAGKPETKFWFG